MNFSSFGAQAAYLLGAANKIEHAIREEVEDQGRAIQTECRRLFGTYQDGWPELAESTQDDRERLGFTPDDPLFRTGALRDAVKVKIEGPSYMPTVFVGVEEGETTIGEGDRAVDAFVVMAAQEWGTEDGHIPPRPVFGTVAKDMSRFNEAAALGIRARADL